MSLLDFRAEIYKVGINFCVDVPLETSEALGGGVHIPVRGTVAGHALRGTLVPRGGGLHRLFLDGRVRRLAGAGEGDTVTVALEPTEWRQEPLPDDLRERLATLPHGVTTFDGQSPGTRQSMLAWLNAARRPETRETRIERIVEEMARRGV